jgi:hypothetical protein
MKTNQNMTRMMGDFEVIQRTQDSMFNATKLLQQWNEHSGQRKDISHFFQNKATKEFIEAIKAEHGITGTADNQIFIKKKGGSDRGSTWICDLLFIDFAMWINPAFKVKVLKFVNDEMIKYRHEAGDEYRELGAAIEKIVPGHFVKTAMMKIAEALNWIVFNRHETGIRNKFGDEQKQRELYTLEKRVADLINEGFIFEYEQVVNYLRKRYHEKNYPKVFFSTLGS